MNTVPAFWRVFGGSLLVTATLGVITVFNSLTADLADLRRGIARDQEARAELVTTAEVETIMNDQEARLQAVEEAFSGLAPASPAGPDAPGA